MEVSSKVLQIEQGRAFVIPKVYSFFIEKEYFVEHFALKRTQGSINHC